MTVVVLRPNATTSNTGALTGGATAHAVLSDNSDASHVLLEAETSVVGIGDLTLPAGAVIKSYAIRARTKHNGTPRSLVWYYPSFAQGGAGTAVNIAWAVATTHTLGTVSAADITDAFIDATQLQLQTTASGVLVYEAYVDITYVTIPVVSADAPTGTITDTNQPTVEWSNTLDSDGGAQTAFEVKVYTDAEYGAGGFDPDTSTPTATSGPTSSSADEWQVDETLADDTYRAYVRVAQTVNGVLHWGDWDFVGFTINVDLPAAPDFTATADNTNARITLVIDDNAGTATTDELEVQRSLDAGTTWTTVRQLVAGNFDAADAPITLYDYEAPNGLTMHYRARALHDYSGTLAASAWVTDTEAWTSTTWRLKHPNKPDLNTTVKIRSFPTTAREGRQGVFQALGATDAIVVQDTRGPKRGTVIFYSDDETAQEALDALLGEHATLMLQSPSGKGGPDYIRCGNLERTRIVDWNDATRVFDSVEFVVVASPVGDVDEWPS